jgi:hypothetical protein
MKFSYRTNDTSIVLFNFIKRQTYKLTLLLTFDIIMVIVPEAIDPQEDIVIRGLSGTGAGTRDLVIMGGVAAFIFQGRANDYNRDELIFKPLPSYSWQIVNRAVVIVSPNSFSQSTVLYADPGGAIPFDAGLAVDGFERDMENNQIRLKVRIACRGPGTYLFRVAYHVTALGLLM